RRALTRDRCAWHRLAAYGHDAILVRNPRIHVAQCPPRLVKLVRAHPGPAPGAPPLKERFAKSFGSTPKCWPKRKPSWGHRLSGRPSKSPWTSSRFGKSLPWVRTRYAACVWPASTDPSSSWTVVGAPEVCSRHELLRRRNP